MTSVKTLLGLLFCATVASATPTTTLTAGLYTFTNITFVGIGCASVTASATAESSNESGGVSSITFSDNDAVAQQTGVIRFYYDVSYRGTDPLGSTTSYEDQVTETENFLGNGTGFSSSDCAGTDCRGGSDIGPVNGQGVILPWLPGESLYSFGIAAQVYLAETSPALTGSPGLFSTTYSAVDTPEPSTAVLSFIALVLLVAIHQVRVASRVKRGRG